MLSQTFLFILVSSLMLLPIIFVKQIRVASAKYIYITPIIALFCFLYFICGRYIFDLINIFQNYQFATSFDASIMLSKTLLLDLCPLMAFLLPLFVLFNKKLNFAKVWCPITIIGALITLYGQAIWDIKGDVFSYLFVGHEPNRLYFMMHLLSLFLSIWVLVLSSKFEMSHFVVNIFCLLFWLDYVLIMISIFGIAINATGLVEYDWINPLGQYHVLYQFWPLEFPYLVIFWYFMAYIFNLAIMLWKNIEWLKIKQLIKNKWKQIAKNEKL